MHTLGGDTVPPPTCECVLLSRLRVPLVYCADLTMLWPFCTPNRRPTVKYIADANPIVRISFPGDVSSLTQSSRAEFTRQVRTLVGCASTRASSFKNNCLIWIVRHHKVCLFLKSCADANTGQNVHCAQLADRSSGHLAREPPQRLHCS